MNDALKEAITARLKKELSRDGFEHTLRTAATAVFLAETHGVDREEAELAALCHDIAKEMSDSQLLAQARRYGLDIDPVEERKPYLLHAAIGARIAAEDYGIDDQRVISAIIKHTFGDTKMDKLDKIVYLADVIEPNRDFKGLEAIRGLAEVDIDSAFAAAYRGQMIFIIEKGGYLHPRTTNVWNQIADKAREIDERPDQQ